MSSTTLKAIEQTKAKLAALEKKAAAEQKKRIVNLHKEAGFATREDLIEALQSLGAAPKKRRGRKAKKVARKRAAKKAVAKKAVAKKKRDLMDKHKAQFFVLEDGFLSVVQRHDSARRG